MFVFVFAFAFAFVFVIVIPFSNQTFDLRDSKYGFMRRSRRLSTREKIIFEEFWNLSAHNIHSMSNHWTSYTLLFKLRKGVHNLRSLGENRYNRQPTSRFDVHNKGIKPSIFWGSNFVHSPCLSSFNVELLKEKEAGFLKLGRWVEMGSWPLRKRGTRRIKCWNM